LIINYIFFVSDSKKWTIHDIGSRNMTSFIQFK